MKILLDNNVPKSLRRSLLEHEVRTAFEEQVSSFSNGVLLQTAEQRGFEVLVTLDRNMEYQQSPQSILLPVLVLIPEKQGSEGVLELSGKINSLLKEALEKKVYRISSEN